MYFVILKTDLHFTFIAYGYTGYGEYGRRNSDEVLKLMQRLSEQHQSLDNSNQNSSSHWNSFRKSHTNIQDIAVLVVVAPTTRNRDRTIWNYNIAGLKKKKYEHGSPP